MKKNKIVKIDIKSQKGFTMQDLLIASFIITLFVGIIATMMFNVYKLNVKLNSTTQMVTYAVQILEDIDKIAYEDVNAGMENNYINKFSIPSGYNLKIDVSKYGENLEDVIKIVNLTISYKILDETEEFTVQRLKIKEI